MKRLVILYSLCRYCAAQSDAPLRWKYVAASAPQEESCAIFSSAVDLKKGLTRLGWNPNSNDFPAIDWTQNSAIVGVSIFAPESVGFSPDMKSLKVTVELPATFDLVGERKAQKLIERVWVVEHSKGNYASCNIGFSGYDPRSFRTITTFMKGVYTTDLETLKYLGPGQEQADKNSKKDTGKYNYK